MKTIKEILDKYPIILSQEDLDKLEADLKNLIIGLDNRCVSSAQVYPSVAPSAIKDNNKNNIIKYGRYFNLLNPLNIRL